MSSMRFLDDLPVDVEHTLDQLTNRFQSVLDGLPELIKNSKDQYSRLGILDRNARQIVVIASPTKRSLAVLDFAGASINDFDEWKTWSSRSAHRAELSADIEGGHGNGGKSFMVRGSTTESYMESCHDGRRTKMGFRNDDPGRRYRPAYYQEHGRDIRGVPESDPLARLMAALAELGCEFGALPAEAKRAFESRRSYTIVYVGGIREWVGRRQTTVKKLISRIPADLQTHSQAALTLETSVVWVLEEERLLTRTPLAVHYPEPMAGFETIPPIPVPQLLPDPDSGDLVDTGEGEIDAKFLQLRTSSSQLRMSERLRGLNVIRVRNRRNVVDNWSLGALCNSAASAFIYGTLQVPALGSDHTAGADRQGLASTPLVRALRSWVAEQVWELASRIQEAQTGRESPADRDAARETLSRMREIMRRYLEPTQGGLAAADGEVDQGDVGPGPRPPVLRGARVDQIELEGGRDRIAIAEGTYVPLMIRCFEVRDDGRKLPVQCPSLNLDAAPPLVELRDDRMLYAHLPGTTRVRVLTESGVASNWVDVEVVRCQSALVEVPTETLKQGQRVQLGIVYITQAGERRDDIMADASVVEEQMGRVSRGGWFSAGYKEGRATIRVRYGPGSTQVAEGSVLIGAERVSEPIHGRGRRDGVPLILMCNEPVPNADQYPPERRTHPGGEQYPTIIDFEPIWEGMGVIWINPRSKEAIRVRTSRGGSSGMASISSKTFQQFLALKCFEILKRLKVRQSLGSREVTVLSTLYEMASAELDCADFLDEAYAVVEDLVARVREGVASS